MRNIGDLMKKAQMVQSQMNILQAKMEKQEFEDGKRISGQSEHRSGNCG